MKGFYSLLSLLILIPQQIEAKKIVYSPEVTEGEFELAYYIDAHKDMRDKEVNSQELEAEYGVGPNDRLSVSWVKGHQSGTSDLLSWKIEWVHNLSDLGLGRNMGAYFEYKQVRSGVDKIEFKPLYRMQFVDQDVELLFNGEFEYELGGGAGNAIELGYAVRVSMTGMDRIEPALEWYGTLGDINDLDAQRQLFGPTVDFKLGHDVEAQLGALFGMTQESENWRIKAQIGIEWD